jgi:hypothetical protein
VDKGGVVGDNYELCTSQIGMKFGHCKNQSQNFAICGPQLRFSSRAVAGSATNDVAFVVRFSLFENSPESNV